MPSFWVSGFCIGVRNAQPREEWPGAELVSRQRVRWSEAIGGSVTGEPEACPTFGGTVFDCPTAVAFPGAAGSLRQMDQERLQRLEITAAEVESAAEVLRSYKPENLDGAQIRGHLRVRGFGDWTSRKVLAYLSLESEFSDVLTKMSKSVVTPLEFRDLHKVDGLL